MAPSGPAWASFSSTRLRYTSLPVARRMSSAFFSRSLPTPDPTVPYPRSPMPTLSTVVPSEVVVRSQRQRALQTQHIVPGLSLDDHACLTAGDHDDGRPRLGVVVVGHAVTVGAGTRGDQDVAGLGRRDAHVAHQHVAGFAVLAGDGDHIGGRSLGLVGKHRLVARVVEHGAQVVAHAAVDGHVGAHAGDDLDGAHRVGGHSGLAGDAAPGFDEDPRHRHAMPLRAGADCGDARLGELGDGAGHVGFGVADAETATHVEDVALEAQVAAPVVEGDEQHLYLAPVRAQVEDLGADVGVDADELEMSRVAKAAHRLLRAAIRKPEAELAVLLTGLHRIVRRGAHAGSDADKDLLAPAAGRGGGFEPFDLREGVDDELPDPGVEPGLDLGHRLVVAVEVDALGREGGGAGGSLNLA